MQRIFPGKTVLIGETGWPSTGRPRGANVPGRVNQARYIREFTSHAAVRGIPYNLIEAFDQPWKRAPEGTVGGYWGLFDVEGHEKFPMVGPVVEAPRWRAAMVVAAVAGVLGALAGLLGGGARVHAAVVLASAGVLAGGIGLRQWEYLHAGNATALDWLVTLLVVGAGWLAFAFAVRALLSRHLVPDTMPRVLGFLLMLSCAYVCLGLVFAGRHRDFPVWLFLPAVVAFTTSAWLDPRLRAHTLRRQRAVEETLLAGWLVTAGVLIPSMEGFQNAGSIGWGASAAALGLSILLPLALESRLNQRPAKHADA
jgi:glucan 1,3-beta-glucosidase